MPSDTWKIIKTRRNRRTGLDVQLIDNRDGSFDDGGQPWITFCDLHGSYCEHETRRLANSHLAEPHGWCESCAYEVFIDDFADEAKALGEPSPRYYREAYETRERVGRCVCCGALMHAELTGYYDQSTCVACGDAQEGGMEEYERVSGERCAALRKLYGAKRYQQITWGAEGIPTTR